MSADGLESMIGGLSDKELLSLLEKASAELKRRNAVLQATGGRSREDAVKGIADALLGKGPPVSG